MQFRVPQRAGRVAGLDIQRRRVFGRDHRARLVRSPAAGGRGHIAYRDVGLHEPSRGIFGCRWRPPAGLVLVGRRGVGVNGGVLWPLHDG